MVSTGGTSLKDDVFRLMSTVHIVIGTPGRIHDIAKKEIVKLNECNIVVLDEVDKLLSRDFEEVVSAIIECSPQDRQIMLFSATYPISVEGFLKKHVPQP